MRSIRPSPAPCAARPPRACASVRSGARRALRAWSCKAKSPCYSDPALMPATIPLVVPVGFSGGGLSMQTTTSRISAEGVFVRSLVPPKEGASVTLALSLPGAPRPVEVSGVVAPLGDSGKGERGFWIRFEDLSDNARALLDSLLRSKGAEGVGRPPAPDAGARTYARVTARFRVGWTSAKD